MDETERVANSLSHKIKKSFSSILTNEDITETLAKSEIINEKMIDMLGVFRSHEKEQTNENLVLEAFEIYNTNGL